MDPEETESNGTLAERGDRAQERLKNFTICLIAILASVALFVTVVFTCLENVAFDESRYFNVQRQVNLGAVTGMSAEDMKMVTRETLAYCRGDRINLDMRASIFGQAREVYDSREKQHMVDVQNLFVKGYKIRTIMVIAFLFLLFVLLYFARKGVFRALAKGWLATISVLGSVLVLVGICFAINFSWAWEQFHYIFFSNNLWQLYENEMLIQLFVPMFDGLVRSIIVWSALALAALTAGAALILLIGRKRHAEEAAR